MLKAFFKKLKQEPTQQPPVQSKNVLEQLSHVKLLQKHFSVSGEKTKNKKKHLCGHEGAER